MKVDLTRIFNHTNEEMSLKIHQKIYVILAYSNAGD